MVVVFANNQVIVAPSGGSSTITTDPVAMGDNDRWLPYFTIDYIINPDGTGLSIQAQTSMDGQMWVNSGAPAQENTAGDFTAPIQTVPVAFLRFQLTYSATGGMGAVGFDLKVTIDHS